MKKINHSTKNRISVDGNAGKVPPFFRNLIWNLLSSRNMGKFCCAVGCSSRSERDKTICFFNVPLEISHQGVQTRELLKKRMAPSRCLKFVHVTFIKVFCYSHIFTENYSSCNERSALTKPKFHSFIKENPQVVHDLTNPDWAPTIILGTRVEELCEPNFKRIGHEEILTVVRKICSQKMTGSGRHCC